MTECKTAAKYPLLISVWKFVKVNGDAIFGGKAKASTGSLNAVYKSHTIGISTQIAPTPSTTRTARRCSSEGCMDRGIRDCFTVLAPPAEKENQGDNDDHDEHHGHGQRGPVAHLAILEGGQVGVVIQHGRAGA